MRDVKRYSLLLIAILTVSFAPIGKPILENALPDIVIRHDRDDAQYLALGNKFPSVCKIGMRGGDGTLIAPQWVITAAHVAEGMFNREGADLRIYFENSDQGYLTDGVFIHPNFAPMQGADVALIKLKTPVKGINPAQLYTGADEAGKEIVIVGHGDYKTGKGGEWKVDGLKRGATNVIDKVGITEIIFDFDEPPIGTEFEGSAGRGDSGGPAFILSGDSPFVAGISSAGNPGKNGPGTYGAVEHYTRVSAYIEWLNKTMSNPENYEALSENSAKSNNNEPRANPTIRRGSGPLPGLGLMLMQEDDKIRIGGKADPMVPKEFREVMFLPPSYIKSLNGEVYTSLEEFAADYNEIEKGQSFTIEFMIQGELLFFEANKFPNIRVK